MTISVEHAQAWERSQLDMRCRSCGATSAASSWCFHCHGRDLEYRTHSEQGPGTKWCETPLVIHGVATPDIA